MIDKLNRYVSQSILGTPEEIGIPNQSATGAELGPILDVVYYVAGVIAVIVIVIAGIMYTYSGGDANQVGKAKKMLTYAIVGLIFIIGAFGITRFIIGRIG